MNTVRPTQTTFTTTPHISSREISIKTLNSQQVEDSLEVHKTDAMKLQLDDLRKQIISLKLDLRVKYNQLDKLTGLHPEQFRGNSC
jgi:hypothetical protein